MGESKFVAWLKRNFSSTSSHDKKIKQVLDLEHRLSNIRDVDILLESILTAARALANADAGSIYVYNEKTNIISIRHGQNDTLQRKLAPGEKLPYTFFSFPATPKSISGYVKHKKKSLNISDVYNMNEFEDAEERIPRPYSFNSATDQATGYHTKSMLTIPLVVNGEEVLGVLQVINAQDERGKVIPFDSESELYITQFASYASQALSNAQYSNRMVMKMTTMANLKDPKETGAHFERVAAFSLEIYDRYASNKKIPVEIREKFRDMLKIAARCHDFGKVGIRDKILKKDGPLTDEERAIMQGHTCLGAQLFSPPATDLEQMALDVTLHHHERWDGGDRGYPGAIDFMEVEPEVPIKKGSSLKGEEIPLAARIVSLADVYDALRHSRSYKQEWTFERTMDIVLQERGKQFDPDVVDAFVQVSERIEAINRAIS